MHLKTPLGLLTITTTSKGVARVDFGKKRDLSTPFDHESEVKNWFENFFKKNPKKFPWEWLDLNGSPFQKKVWRVLWDIPFGETRSYKDIAQTIKNPKAVRAVGGANGKNPVPIIIPCHRVISADGSLGGFSCGLPLKRKLLKHEGMYHSPPPRRSLGTQKHQRREGRC